MDITTIKSSLRAGLNTYRAFEHAEKAIEAIEQSSNYLKELEAAAKLKKSEVEKLESQRSDIADKVSLDKLEADKILSAAKAKADDIVANAEMRASAIAAKAAEKVANIEANNAELGNKGSLLRSEINELEAKKAELEALIAKMKAV